jgi:hypothetical protein
VIQPEAREGVESFISDLSDYGRVTLRFIDAYDKLKVENVLHLVMPVTTLNRQSSAYVAYRNKASLAWYMEMYALSCASVRRVKGWRIQPSRN